MRREDRATKASHAYTWSYNIPALACLIRFSATEIFFMAIHTKDQTLSLVIVLL